MSSDDLKNTAKDTVDRAGQSVRDASSAAQGYAAQAQDFVGQAGTAAKDVYGQARDSAKDAVDHASDYAADAAQSAHRAYRRGNEELAHRVAKQPLEALLLAGAIGYLVGWAANRA